MTKVVYNACYGGFSLSFEALEVIYAARGKDLYVYKKVDEHNFRDGRYVYTEHTPTPHEMVFGYEIFDLYMGDEYDEDKLAEEESNFFNQHRVYNHEVENMSRHDPVLIAAVETLGKKAGGAFADLQIATIKGNKYRIDEYDGFESVLEPEDYDWIEV